MTIANRPAFNVLYLGMNQKQKPLDDIRVRQAIAHAINLRGGHQHLDARGHRAGDPVHPRGGQRLRERRHDLRLRPRRREGADRGGRRDRAEIEFNYPTGVSRPYMPDPEATFNIIRTQLEAVGLKIMPTADQWDPDYLEKIQGTPDHGIHLLGLDRRLQRHRQLPRHLLRSAESNEWGFDNPEIFQALDEARGLPDGRRADPALRGDQPPGHGLPAWRADRPPAAVPRVRTWRRRGYEPSPVQDEVWNLVTVPAVSGRLTSGSRAGGGRPMLRFALRRLVLMVPSWQGSHSFCSSGSGPCRATRPGRCSASERMTRASDGSPRPTASTTRCSSSTSPTSGRRAGRLPATRSATGAAGAGDIHEPVPGDRRAGGWRRCCSRSGSASRSATSRPGIPDLRSTARRRRAR